MFQTKLLILVTCFIISGVELKPYWGMQQRGYPNNFYGYPQPLPNYPLYTPQYPQVLQNYPYPYGVNQGLNSNGYQQRIADPLNPTKNIIKIDETAENNLFNKQNNGMQQYAVNYPYPTASNQQQFMDEIINEEDLPNFVAKIQGRPLPEPAIPSQQPQDYQIDQTWQATVNEPVKQTAVKRYTYGPHVKTNSYVDSSPKKVTVIRSFPTDGSKPKVQIISDMSTKQTPSDTIIINEVDNDNDENTNDPNETDEDDVAVDENELDTNAIVTENDSSEDESHPKPILHWPF